MQPQYTASVFNFKPLRSRAVTAQFNAGFITSDAGALLLSELDAHTRVIERFASCFIDHRSPRLIEHTVSELVAQRVFGLILGYEDLSDHDTLRVDPLLATLCQKADPTGNNRYLSRDKGKPLAAHSTLNRLELTPPNASSRSRYKKIVYQPDLIDELFVDVFVEHLGQAPEELILGIDTTDDPVHGQQEGRFFHGYYDCYCDLPLYVFCGHDLLLARLNTADLGPAQAALNELPGLLARLRKRLPHVRILLRGDSAFATEPLMALCEANSVEFLFGLAGNSRLLKELKPSMDQAKELYCLQWPNPQAPVRVFHDFIYQTRETWTKARRVVGKAEHLKDGPNPRFIVTSLSTHRIDARPLYEQLYCARGDMENRLKEQQLGMFADRTSTATIRANQLRLFFSSVAYVLVNLLRKLVLKGTPLEKAQVGTLRLKLFKIGALVHVSVRRVFIQMTSAYPAQALFSTLVERIRRLTLPTT